MWGIYGTQFQEGEFDMGISLFGIPFLIGSIVLVGMVLYTLFGKWKINLNSGLLEVGTGIGPVAWKRSIRYHSDSRVRIKATKLKSDDHIQKAVSVETDAEELQFGTAIPDDVKKFIAAAILEEIRNR